MRSTESGSDQDIMMLNMQELHNMAGVDTGDSDFVCDQKIMTWIGRRKYRVIDAEPDNLQSQINGARADGIEILIIKER